MSEFSDWRYAKALDRVSRRIRERSRSVKRVRPIIFLCGAKGSADRLSLRRYIRQTDHQLLVFFAEDAWEHVKPLRKLNALQLENELGAFADALVIIVESAGTIAEVGAFAASERLRKKLLLLLLEEHQGADSFIQHGPIAWHDKDSRFAPAIYYQRERIALSGDDVLSRLQKITNRGRPEEARREQLSANPPHLLALLADVVGITGPVRPSACLRVLRGIIDGQPTWDVDGMLALLQTVGLVSSFKVEDVSYFYRPLEAGSLESFQSGSRFNLPEERLDFLSVLLGIDAARPILEKMKYALSSDGHDAQ
jgi:hypothetical protein